MIRWCGGKTYSCTSSVLSVSATSAPLRRHVDARGRHDINEVGERDVCSGRVEECISFEVSAILEAKLQNRLPA
ncbi:hypothetical protein L208DRAFT_1389646 [Tricholoma matsutake]|nr:hypothetical protein L208DRAFT_1389646 [Tricholoma matsutake 945]